MFCTATDGTPRFASALMQEWGAQYINIQFQYHSEPFYIVQRVNFVGTVRIMTVKTIYVDTGRCNAAAKPMQITTVLTNVNACRSIWYVCHESSKMHATSSHYILVHRVQLKWISLRKRTAANRVIRNERKDTKDITTHVK